MNPTHEPNNPDQRPALGENFLVDLLTDQVAFNAWVATAAGTAAHPVNVPAEPDTVGYQLTDAGRAALDTSGDEPVAWVAVRGWCEICGRALPWKCAWSEPLCQDCAVYLPLQPGYDWLDASVEQSTTPGGIIAETDSPASTCPVDLVTETSDETTARVLRDAATYVERNGWIQGAYYDSTSGSFSPPACTVGAIAMVCYGGPCDAPAQQFDDPGFLDFEAAVLHLDRYLLVEDSSEAYEFNDAKGRTAEDIIRVLRDAAARPAHELIDALRAIDEQNADTAALAAMLIPGGTFAEDGGSGSEAPSRVPTPEEIALGVAIQNEDGSWQFSPTNADPDAERPEFIIGGDAE